MYRLMTEFPLTVDIQLQTMAPETKDLINLFTDATLPSRDSNPVQQGVHADSNVELNHSK